MTTSDIIVVAGLGRCGSSLTMQMLEAAGIPCNGEYPAFEHLNGSTFKQDPKWLRQQSGRATKILMPDKYKFLPAEYKFVWLDREPIHQASSTLKFKHLVIGKETNERDAAKTIVNMALHYDLDASRCIQHLQKYGPLHRFAFEYAILYPKDFARMLNSYLGIDGNIKKMASIIVSRSIAASLTMDLEASLINERQKLC